MYKLIIVKSLDFYSSLFVFSFLFVFRYLLRGPVHPLSNFFCLCVHCFGLKIFKFFSFGIICNLHMLTFNFCIFLIFDQRTITSCAGRFVVIFVCSWWIWKSCTLELSSKIKFWEWVVLLMSPFSFIRELSMLMARRFKTPILMC